MKYTNTHAHVRTGNTVCVLICRRLPFVLPVTWPHTCSSKDKRHPFQYKSMIYRQEARTHAQVFTIPSSPFMKKKKNKRKNRTKRFLYFVHLLRMTHNVYIRPHFVCPYARAFTYTQSLFLSFSDPNIESSRRLRLSRPVFPNPGIITPKG